MDRYPEEEAIFNKIFTVTTPLEKIIIKQGKEIERLRKIVLKEQDEYRSDIIDELSKSIPLYTRFKVFLEMQHLNIAIETDPALRDVAFTDEQGDAAHEWAKDTALYLLKQLKEWEEDGRPEEHISTSKLVDGYGTDK